MDLSLDFWNNITNFLSLRNSTMKEMCEHCSISYATVKTQKSKGKLPDILDVIKIAAFLNVTIEDLFSLSDKKEFPDDIYQIAVGLSQLTPDQREPLVFMIQGQIEFYKNKDK